MTAVCKALRLMAIHHKKHDSWPDAAAWLARLFPLLTASAQEDLGCWPASDPDARALQNVKVKP